MMNVYTHIIHATGDGLVSPAYVKLGNRSEVAKNHLMFILPDGYITPDTYSSITFRHESGRLFTIAGIFTEANVTQVEVPVSVQSVPGYYVITLAIYENDGTVRLITNEIKGFVSGDSFGRNPMAHDGLTSVVQSPTIGYLTVYNGTLYTSDDNYTWYPVLSNYMIAKDPHDTTVYEYGQIVMIDNNDGSFSIKVGNGLTPACDLPLVAISDVTADGQHVRVKGKWEPLDKIVDVSEDGNWVIGGIEKDLRALPEHLVVGTVTQGNTPDVTLTPHPTEAGTSVMDFVLPNAVISNTEWVDVLNKPGIDGNYDIIISPTAPATPPAGRTIIWINGTPSQ